MAGLIKQKMGETEGVDENNPAFIQAMKYSMHVLYEQDAAGDIAKQLKTAKDKTEGLANIAYDITSTVDEKTQGQVPREMIALLAMAILKEVIDIAEAIKMDIKPIDAANAFKQMLLRFLGENGVDTTQLQQSMDKVDPKVFEQQQGA
jgi:hypothetical protein